MKETTLNKLHLQILKNIYISIHLQVARHVVSAAL